MFYSRDILQKRGGRFSIVWLAAMRCAQLSRRELSSVNVRRTCDEIVEYILQRVPPLHAGSGRPRFSLYLSSQLMYGVVKIFGKQQEFLLGDASAFFSRIKVLATTVDIDIKSSLRSDLVTNVDMASEAGKVQVGYDPEFGSFRSDDEFLNFLAIPDMEIMMSPLASPRQDILPFFTKKFRPETGSPHTVSSSDEISMKDIGDQQAKDIEVPGEKELPHFDGTELEMILEEPEVQMRMEDLIPLSRQPASTPLTIEPVSIDKQQLPPEEETPAAKLVESEPPAKRTRYQTPGVTPIEPHSPVRGPRKHLISLEMELTPVTPSPVRRKRKRQLMFADRETQISKEVLRQQMQSGKDLCEQFILPSTFANSASDLLSRPGGRELKDGLLQFLWQRNAHFEISETDSDKERSLWTIGVQARQRRVSEWILDELDVERRQVDQQHTLETERETHDVQEVPSMEILRDASMSMEKIRHLDEISLSLEKSKISDLDDSRDLTKDDSLIKRPRTRSRGGTSSEDETDRLQEPHQEEQRSVIEASALYVVPEEQDVILSPFPELQTQDPQHSPSYRGEVQHNLIRLVLRKTLTSDWIEFSTICPPEKMNKVEAARMFSILLDLCSNRILCVRQENAFAVIYVGRGDSH